MTYNFLTAGPQNVLLLLAVVEELSSHTFMFFFKICAKDRYSVFDLILLIFSELAHRKYRRPRSRPHLIDHYFWGKNNSYILLFAVVLFDMPFLTIS